MQDQGLAAAATADCVSLVDGDPAVRRARQLMLRTSPSHPDVFVLALLDRERADPGLARTRLIEVERRLS